MIRKLKLLFAGATLLSMLMVALCLGSYEWIDRVAHNRIITNVNDLGEYDVALVLGTSKYLKNGHNNQYFTYRIDAAAELYKKGKVKKILVSGDNSTATYNEPRDMLQALIAKGIPEKDIVLDYAGFRTFDSMIRARDVFGQNRFVVVSQEFHAERAVYIARANQMDVVGFTAKNPKVSWKYMFTREILARTKALLDCNILGTTPRFLGEKVDMGV